MTIAQELIDSFARIVRSDGGTIGIISATDERTELAYMPGTDPDCADGACVLPHLELQEMMREWLARRAPGHVLVIRLAAKGNIAAGEQA